MSRAEAMETQSFLCESLQPLFDSHCEEDVAGGGFVHASALVARDVLLHLWR